MSTRPRQWGTFWTNVHKIILRYVWKGACDIIQEKEGPIVHFFFIVILYTPKSPINLYNTKSAFLGFQWVALRKNYVWTEWMKKKKWNISWRLLVGWLLKSKIECFKLKLVSWVLLANIVMFRLFTSSLLLAVDDYQFILGVHMTSPKFKLRNYFVFWVSTFIWC